MLDNLLLLYLIFFIVGSGLIVGPNLLPLFEQLEIMDEFIALGKATTENIISREKGGPLCTVSTLVHKEM